MPLNDYLIQCDNDEAKAINQSGSPVWDRLFQNVDNIGFNELSSRQADLNWYLTENGVTYNVYNDPQGLNRPWNLNAIPTLMDEKEWVTVEKGIQQRAELFNLVLKDLYGKRELITKGIIPQEVIYSHRGFRNNFV